MPVHKVDNLIPPSCGAVMKSGNLNIMEPSGPLQACNGTALPFTFTFTSTQHNRVYLNLLEPNDIYIYKYVVPQR